MWVCGSNPHLSIKITLMGEFSPVGNRKMIMEDRLMEIKEMKCKVCNHPLNISKENVYVAKVENVFFHTSKNYSATDCPYCGCQNLLQERFEKVTR